MQALIFHCDCHRHGRFIIDVLATVPFVYLLVVLSDMDFSGTASSKWLVILSLVRLLRLARLVSISKVRGGDTILCFSFSRPNCVPLHSHLILTRNAHI